MVSFVKHTRFPQDSKTRSQHLITSSTSESLKWRLRSRRIHVQVEERDERRMRVLELFPSSTSHEPKSIAHSTAREKFNDQPMPNSTIVHITLTTNHGNLEELLSTLQIIQVLSHNGQTNMVEECQSGPKDDAISGNADGSDKDVFAAEAYIGITTLLEAL
ncbi:uncharacterized protein EAE98_006375 [Botrytis deweyae]|uniref:Uncharacterized protein n=1 Tax=Botrytis deweyae TaxID=2478750 RepID=A0ABQ7IKQ7_9HELO|nr:uncharacterized protein EAE98_006375 [Botrytis deweyae]KAF7926991.1 hypothetical protein EAE98_006375 [Botrytis deweyae]